MYVQFCSLARHHLYRVHTFEGFYILEYWTGEHWVAVDASETEHYGTIPSFINALLEQGI